MASAVADDLLMDLLTDKILVLTKICVDVLLEVDVNVFADVMTAFEFVMPGPLE